MQHTIVERMGAYSAYHQDARCQATHLFGVPMVFYAPLIPLAWLSADLGGFTVTLGAVILAAILIWYFTLDAIFATIMTLVSIPAAYAAHLAAALPWQQGLAIFLAIKLGGWAIQLVGHAYEGRRPALADNLTQSLMGPLFVVAEITFALGFRKKLKAAVEERVEQHVFPEQQAAQA